MTNNTAKNNSNLLNNPLNNMSIAHTNSITNSYGEK